MKVAIFCTILFIFFSIDQVKAQTVTVNTAIMNSAEHFLDRLPSGSTVIVLNFQSAHERLAEHIINRFTMYMVNDGRLIVVDRLNLEAIRQEMDLSLSGDVSDEAALTIGRMLGAQTIISGSATPMGNVYNLWTRAISVETAVIQSIHNITIAMDTTLAALTSGEDAAPLTVMATQADSADIFSLAGRNVFAIGLALGGGTGGATFSFIITAYERHFQNPFGLSFFVSIDGVAGMSSESSLFRVGSLAKWRTMNDRLLLNAGFSFGSFILHSEEQGWHWYDATTTSPAMGLHSGISFRLGRILSLSLDAYYIFALGSMEMARTGTGQMGQTASPNIGGVQLGIRWMWLY